ncbi:uncharacterized protein [Venturia canescens]|uniref:uncharacterized protein isoform X2 n=1 Tax=Venturia canescens TaxID=32260 RepID=UPI001C9CCD40|nr:uncharacterized protein LOC122410778 isoform X2 [Venturia canescens]
MSDRKRMPSYRPWGSTDDGNIEFESLTTETLQGALTVIREEFFTDENVSVGVELTSEPGASEELEELCLDAIKDGVSVVAIDVTTGKVVGAALNKIQIRGDPSTKGSFELFSERCKWKSSKALVDFMINVDSRLDLFNHYNVDCILEIMFMATKRSYRQRRIGELLVVSSMEIGRELNRGKNVKVPVEIKDNDTITNENCIPSLVSMIATSNFTKKIADRLGFSTLVKASFDEFTFADKTFSQRIGNLHKFTWLIAKRLIVSKT